MLWEPEPSFSIGPTAFQQQGGPFAHIGSLNEEISKIAGALGVLYEHVDSVNVDPVGVEEIIGRVLYLLLSDVVAPCFAHHCYTYLAHEVVAVGSGSLLLEVTNGDGASPLDKSARAACCFIHGLYRNIWP